MYLEEDYDKLIIINPTVDVGNEDKLDIIFEFDKKINNTTNQHSQY